MKRVVFDDDITANKTIGMLALSTNHCTDRNH